MEPLKTNQEINTNVEQNTEREIPEITAYGEMPDIILGVKGGKNLKQDC